MRINPHIFKAYDIRGKYPSEFNEESAEKIGAAAAVFFLRKTKKKKPTILVCRDVRISSPFLREAIIRGVNSQGCDALDVGIGTTPFFYFLMHRTDADGGIMVTASHNPAEYNGFKFRLKGGSPVSYGSGLEKIKALALGRKIASKKGIGRVLPPAKDYHKMYLDFQTRGVVIDRVRAVVDASGGSCAYFLPEFLARFPHLTYKPLFFEPDGSFANHPPNPLLSGSQKFVRREIENGHFNFGAIFDGDGDRVVFFDENGEMVRPDFIAALFMIEELKRHKNASFVFTVNTSRGPREYLAEKGAKIILSPIGYVNVQPLMKKYGAQIGTEISGHFSFKKFFYDDSALMAFLRLAQIISRTHRPLSQLVAPFVRYISSEEINLSIKDKKGALKRVLEFYRGIPEVKISKLDGISIDFPDWRFNLRPSNTEPYIRLVIEARTQEMYDEKMKELERIIGKH